MLQRERVQHWEPLVWLTKELRIKKENSENPGIGDSWIHPEERRWCSQNPEAGVQLDRGNSEPSGPIPYKDLGRQLLALPSPRDEDARTQGPEPRAQGKIGGGT